MNISPDLCAAIERLKCSDLVVVEADKGMGVCVCSRDYARAALAVHLSDTVTYRRVDCDADVLLAAWRERAQKAMVDTLHIFPEVARQALAGTSMPVFRTLPKVHKMAGGVTFDSRPITSACNSPTTPISNALVSLLAPLTAHDGWTLDSSYVLMRLLERNTTPIPPGAVFLCADVCSLYTNMNVELTIRLVCMRFAMFHGVSVESTPVRAIRTLLNLLLRDNLFVVPAYGEHGESVAFSQQHGIPMGLSVCVILANIFVGSLFTPVFRRFHDTKRGKVLLRAGYVDDTIACIEASPEAIQQLIAELNALHPSITITTVIDSSQAVFLDMVIFKGARWSGSGHTLLDCRVHTKPGSLHLYIPSFSCHPRGATTGFISGEARRFVCLSTSHEGALEQCLVFARALYARGYPIDTIVNELGKVDYNKRFQYLRLTPTPTSSVVNPVDASDARVVAFVVPYTPITARWGIGKALKECFESTPHLTPVLAWSNSPNLQRTLSLRNLKPAPPALLNPPPC